MLIEQQIAERRERAQNTITRILKRPAGQPFGDYQIKSASGKTYRVALRGSGLFESFCSCPDFAVNTLGTCKHIEALLLKVRRRRGAAVERNQFKRSRASVSLQYGERLEVRLRLPVSPSTGLLALAKEHFDEAGLLRPESHGRFESVLEQLRALDDQAVVYSDVLEFLDRENETAEGLEWERRLLSQLQKGEDPLAGVLKTKLLPYQIRGALFAAGRGRVVLADDMGLGKTIQALAAAELLRRRRGIQRVLVIAPASVKYQWKTEIERFTGHSAQVIDGLLLRRKTLYGAPAFFNLTSYEVVLRDLEYMHRMQPDLIILDEAQRIRNWATATARTIKQLKSRYAFVLTGTPLENKLEELFSVVEFVDARRLGPAFRFLKEHRLEDDKGRLLGYRGLDRIHQQLEPVLLRRTRKEVLTQLPPRTDQVFRVPLTKEQAEPYFEQSDILAGLMRKWERQGWLSEIDLRRVTCCIQNMRMLCNSTFLFDKATHHSPKLDEFREVIRELALEENRKVVVFSEYERMTHLAGRELTRLGIGFVSLHGGVPARKRGSLISQFHRDPGCQVFLSTDAGGVGLNLQAASAVINFEPPWNPARLEQRIGRVHRLGQQRPVHVVHFLTTDSIEERVWETLRIKKSLFAGVFDAPTDEVSFAALGKKSALEAVKEVFAGQPGRPKPAIEAAPPFPVPVAARAVAAHSNGEARPDDSAAVQRAAPRAAPAPELEPLAGAAAGLLEAGLRLLETIVPPAGAVSDETSGNPIRRWLSTAIQTDPRTNRPVLALPLPESITRERLAGALTGLLAALGGPR
jgi:superfamily II DNA or RNA helicase